MKTENGFYQTSDSPNYVPGGTPDKNKSFLFINAKCIDGDSGIYIEDYNGHRIHIGITHNTLTKVMKFGYRASRANYYPYFYWIIIK